MKITGRNGETLPPDPACLWLCWLLRLAGQLGQCGLVNGPQISFKIGLYRMLVCKSQLVESLFPGHGYRVELHFVRDM